MPSKAARTVINQALLSQLAAAVWGSPPESFTTASLRFQSWAGFDAALQPALFVRRIVEDVSGQKAYGLNKYAMRYEVWIYARVEANTVNVDPYQVLDPIIDAVDAALAAGPVTGRNNLSATTGVDDCRISGQIVIADGSDDGQAVVRIPVEVFCGI